MDHLHEVVSDMFQQHNQRVIPVT